MANDIKEQLYNNYKAKKDTLAKEIEEAKRQSWRKLVDDLGEDIWGMAYKIMRK